MKRFNFANTVMVNSTVLPHFRKTDSIMYLPYMKPLREKMRRLHLFDCEESFSAFTLAETLITLTILGIVAAITVPMLINRQQEAANRTKLKKAMSMYEKALNTMIIENDLKTDASIKAEFPLNDCSKTTEYFKKVEEKTPCRFKTADRIWWDISDIQNPLIILNDKKKDETVANLKALAKDTDDITTYGFVGKIDNTNSTIRINDNAFEQANGTADQKAYMSKLYNFINKVKSNNGSAVANDPYSRFAAICTNQCEFDWDEMKASNCDSCTFKGSADEDWGSWTDNYIIDENGNIVKATHIENCNNENGSGTFICYEATYNADGSVSTVEYCPNENGNGSNKCYESTDNADGSGYEKYWDEDGVEHKIRESVIKPDGTRVETGWDENGNKTHERTVNPDGSGYEKSWDEDGVEHKTWERAITPDGSIVDTSWDINGDKTHERVENPDGSGHESRKKTWYSGDESSDVFVPEWEKVVNPDGSWTETVHDITLGYVGNEGYIGNAYIATSFDITTDNNGNKEYGYTCYNSDGQPTYHTKPETINKNTSNIFKVYDAEGNEVSSYTCQQGSFCMYINGSWWHGSIDNYIKD